MPTVGASNGDTAMNRNSRDSTRAASSRGKKSRTIATAATWATHPPSACTNRSPIRVDTSGANAHPTDAATNSPNPTTSGGFRPNRSSSGP